jgi:hypothetical protein
MNPTKSAIHQSIATRMGYTSGFETPFGKMFDRKRKTPLAE